MSDRDEVGTSGYSTPVPELDDHRNQVISVPRADRPRRGTFDSLYGARQFATGEHQSNRVADFEQAVEDDDGAENHIGSRSARRPTVEMAELPRAVSPPNSVKAFAEARRREREMSISETRPDRKNDEFDLARAASIVSRPSYSARPRTAGAESASLLTNKSAEGDVCFPVQDERHAGGLHIDFDYLENFIRADGEARRAARRAPSVSREFPDLRPQLSNAAAPVPMVTSNGDFIDMPSTSEDIVDEKTGHTAPEPTPKQAPRPLNDPSRVSFFSSAWESTIHAADLEGLILPGEDIRGLFTFPKEESDGVWWLNLNNPSEEEVRAVCRAFGIHPLTTEDVLTQEAREKIELFPFYYFACFRSFYLDIDPETREKEYAPFNIYVVVFREGTLSFSYASNPHASHVRKRITMLKDYVALSSDWICYALIDDIVDSFAPAISQVEQETDQIEDEVFVARADDMAQFLRRIGNTRKNIMGLMRLLGGKADVLKGFTKRCNENYKVTPRMDIGLYLGDIQDHVVTMMTNLSHFEKILSRTHGNYLAQLSIDHLQQGTNTNAVLSKITLLASIIVPLNVVTGIFGMNVHIPWQGGDSLNAFAGILGVMVAFVVLMLVAARRYKFI